MAHKGGLEALDIRSRNSLMGGMTVLLAGDIRQTLPVVQRGTRADELKAWLKSSYLWPKVQIRKLEINMRVYIKGDIRAEWFSNLLLQIGNGESKEENGKVVIPDNLCHLVTDLDSLNGKIYPELKRIKK
jgi:hypothetical protein